MAPKKKQLTAEEKEARKKADEAKKAKARAAEIKLHERRTDEFNMWVAGGSFRDIAAQISRRGETVSKSTVEKDINLLLDKKEAESTEFHERLKLKNMNRIERLILSHWNSALKDKDVGKFVAGLIKQENELFGLNSAIKIENSGTVTVRKSVDLSDISKDDLLAMESILKKTQEKPDAA